MLMAGMGRRKSIFGAPMMSEGQTPPFIPPMAGQDMPQFQKPDTKHLIAGVIGDTLSTLGGGQASFLPGLAQQKLLSQRYQQQQAQRTADFDDFTRRERWKLDHPAPVNNDTINDFKFIQQTLGPDAAQQYLRSVAAGPPVAVDGVDAQGNQTRSYVPRGQLYGAPKPAGAPPGVTFTPLPAGGAGSGPRGFR